MNQPTSDFREADPELLRALASQYVDYHRSIENYSVAFSIEFWLVRRLGIEPRRWMGRLAGGSSTSSWFYYLR